MKVKTITCPNCGHANNFLAEECTQCGIHFSRYYEELEKAEALRLHIEEQEKAEALRREQEEKERQEAEARRKEEEEKAEALRREQEEQERIEAEAREREAEERRQAEEEARRLEEERRIEAQKRADILKRQKEELEKAEALKRQKEEEEKAEAERRRKEEEEKAETERRHKEEEEKAEADRRRKEEEEKAEAERREQEERERREAEKRQQEEEARAEAQRREQEEQERREAEEREREAEERRRQEEDQALVIAADAAGDAVDENRPQDEIDEIEIEELDSAAIEAQAGAFDYIEYPPEGPVIGDQSDSADPSASPPSDYQPAASLQARLEFYEGRMIGLTYGNPAEIQNVKLMAVSSDHFQVFYPIPRHVVSFAYGAIVSITENAEGLSAVGPDISPVFPVVVELPRPFFHNH